MSKLFSYKIISYLYLILLTLAFLFPLDSFLVTSIVEKESHPSDKNSLIIHSILLFILYSLFNIIYLNKIKLIIFCSIYSFLIEILQIYTGRGFSFLDILFNLFGIAIAFLLLNFFLNKNYEK